MAEAPVRRFTDAGWESEVLAAGVPVLAGFWAEWCLPCRTLPHLLEEAALRFAGRMRVGSLDVDEQPATAERYGIQGLPTLLLLRAGEVIVRRVGVVDPRDLVRLLEPRIG